MHLPATVGDYTDFYVGINHAVTVGSLFRPDDPVEGQPVRCASSSRAIS